MRSTNLTDAPWDRQRPLPPPRKPSTGRPAKDHRTVLDGILWIWRTGCPWRCLPERHGSWKTVSGRFYRRQKAEVWNLVLSGLPRQADAEGRSDWSLHVVDRTVVRVHQHASGAKGGTRKPRGSGAA